jgi:transposase
MEREYIGIDLHKQFFQGCALSATGARLWEQRFPRTDGGVTLLRARCTPASAIAVEATGPTWAFVDALQPSGATICVVDPRKTRLKAGYAAKTDRLDARRLADALRRESVVSIYVPPRRFANCGKSVGVGTSGCGCGRASPR